MIQDIAPHVYSNTYADEKPDRNSIALYFEKNTALVKQTDGEILFPTFAQLEKLNEDIYEGCNYLFSIDKERFFLVREINLERLSGYTMENIESFRHANPQYRAFAGITGYQLSRWYENHRYCGCCGTRMEKDTKERMLFCPKCHNIEYPKICPAVIIGLTNGDKILLSKYSGRTYKKFALLAGFVEIGEPIEDTVRREVMEEVGLKVKNITYYKSQPWSFSDTILMGFFAELDGDDKISLDEEELAMAGWYAREELPVEEERDSLTNEMIMYFRNNTLS